MQHEEQQRKWAKIVAQAWADPEFKARLLANPTQVLKDEGVAVPAGTTLRVVENTDTTTHLVLPAMSDAAQVAADVDVRAALGCYPCW